jgi:DnaK suppressor protein
MVTKGGSTRVSSKRLTLIMKKLPLFQNLLSRKKGEILKEVRDMENRWEETSEPQIEVEERAQAIELTEPYAPLDEIERSQLKEIDLALKKIENGIYGICEACGKPIALNRLKVIPWTRYCRRDAEKGEIIPPGDNPAFVSD